jgi:hypothetical protein
MIPTSLHLRQPPAWQRELQRAVTDPAELLAILGLGPLLRQILPLGSELDDVPGYLQDPVGDLNSRAGPGELHKYAARALLVTTGACAINCR